MRAVFYTPDDWRPQIRVTYGSTTNSFSEASQVMARRVHDMLLRECNNFEGLFARAGAMTPKLIQSLQQADGYNCGVIAACLAVEPFAKMSKANFEAKRAKNATDLVVDLKQTVKRNLSTDRTTRMAFNQATVHVLGSFTAKKPVAAIRTFTLTQQRPSAEATDVPG